MNTAQDPLFREITQTQVAEFQRSRWYHSIELRDSTLIPGIVGLPALRKRIDSFPIPPQLYGKRVLDIGAATGWCSFEMERRGASVTATDCVEFEEFLKARELLASAVEYRILDIEETNAWTLGTFDYALLFGVLYHVRHPLLTLENLCTLTTEAAFIESFVTDSEASIQTALQSKPLLEFYETDELGGQIDNWFGPNLSCLVALCRSAGFARVAVEYITDRRAGVTCYRRWEAPPPEVKTEWAPAISSAVNNRTNDIHFSTDKDEYIVIYFDSSEPDIRKEDLRVEIDGLGAPALRIDSIGACAWQASVRRPPGLASGAHQLRLRTRSSAASKPFGLFVGQTKPVGPKAGDRESTDGTDSARIIAVQSNVTGTSDVAGHRHEYISCFFETTARDLERDDIVVQLGSLNLRGLLLLHPNPDKWQVNVRLPPRQEVEGPSVPVAIQVRNGPWSQPWLIRWSN